MGSLTLTRMIASEAVGRRLRVKVVVPGGHADPDLHRPILIFLHGRADNESSNLVQGFFDALNALGSRAPVVAFPHGETRSYFYNRSEGRWADFVVEEVIPEVASLTGANADHVAIGGISMGGFGALNMVRMNPGRFQAAGAHSAALYKDFKFTLRGAFDGPEDFDANDVIGAARTHPELYEKTKIWLDVVDTDPVVVGNQAFADALRDAGQDPELHVVKWGYDSAHTHGYWDHQWHRYLGFYAEALHED